MHGRCQCPECIAESLHEEKWEARYLLVRALNWETVEHVERLTKDINTHLDRHWPTWRHHPAKITEP